MSTSAGDHIILVHGIRDAAFWSETLKEYFEKKENTIVTAIRVEIVDLVSFIFPITFLRNRFIQQYRDKIEGAINGHENHRTIIIAHSFGSYAVAHILDDTDIKIDKLIMCGAIVPKKFPWARILRANFPRSAKLSAGKAFVGPILNELSPRDSWPILARVCSLGYGDVGATGCGSPIEDRRHGIKHSEYLDLAFADKYWLPYIQNGTINRPGKDSTNPSKSMVFFLTRFPRWFNLMGFAIFGLFSLLVLVSLYKWSEQPRFRVDLIYDDFKIDGRYYLPPGQQNATLEPTIDISADGQAANSAAFVYSRDNTSVFEKSAISASDTRHIKIVVNRRPIIGECLGGNTSGDPGSNAEKLDVNRITTTYSLSYVRDTWYNNMLNSNWSGEARFQMKYQPTKMQISEDGKDLGEFDKLSITALLGVLDSSVKMTQLVHSPDDCKDESQRSLMYTVKYSEDSETTATVSIFGRAWAQITRQARPIETASVKSALESPDEKTRALTLDSIGADPSAYKDFLGKALQSQSILDDDRLADLLRVLSASSKTDLSAQGVSIIEILGLAAHPNVGVRDAARSLLRSPGVATSDNIRQVREHIVKNQDSLSREKVGNVKFSKLYLILIAVRDMYYNLALRTFESGVDLENGDSALDQTVTASVDLFNQGAALADFVEVDYRSPMAKNLYGLALVRFRYAQIMDVLRINPKLSRSQTFDAIAQNVADGAKLRSKENPSAEAAFNSFKNFILKASAKNGQQPYPWPVHVEQARACTRSDVEMAYSCLENFR